jgi:hypothetical protein
MKKSDSESGFRRSGTEASELDCSLERANWKPESTMILRQDGSSHGSSSKRISSRRKEQSTSAPPSSLRKVRSNGSMAAALLGHDNKITPLGRVRSGSALVSLLGRKIVSKEFNDARAADDTRNWSTSLIESRAPKTRSAALLGGKKTLVEEEGEPTNSKNWSPALPLPKTRSAALLGRKMMNTVEEHEHTKNKQWSPHATTRSTALLGRKKTLVEEEGEPTSNKNWSPAPPLPSKAKLGGESNNKKHSSLRRPSTMAAAVFFSRKSASEERTAENGHDDNEKSGLTHHQASPTRSKSSNATLRLGLGSSLKRDAPHSRFRKSDPSPRDARSKSTGPSDMLKMHLALGYSSVTKKTDGSANSATTDYGERKLILSFKSKTGGAALAAIAERSKSMCSDLLEIPKVVAGGITSTGSAVAGGITSTGSAVAGGITSTGTALAGGITSTGTALAGGITSTGTALAGGITSTGTALAGGITSTKTGLAGVITSSGAALAGGITSTGRSVSRASVLLTKSPSTRPEALFVEMATWNPMDADDRARYDDTAVRRILARNPDAARAKYEVQLGGRGNLTVSRYPLSTLVALGASVETIRLAIRACPMALRPSDEFRSTPLHTACTFNTNVEVVRYLYRKYPEAIKQTTNYVYLPIHNACQTGIPEPCSLDMIQFLVETYPEGLMTINKLGDTPLRTAERNEHITGEVLAYLQEETERVFSLEENENRRDEVVARQSWGSKRGNLERMISLPNLRTSSSEFSIADVAPDWSESTEAETSGEFIPPGESSTAD